MFNSSSTTNTEVLQQLERRRITAQALITLREQLRQRSPLVASHDDEASIIAAATAAALNHGAMPPTNTASRSLLTLLLARQQRQDDNSSLLRALLPELSASNASSLPESVVSMDANTRSSTPDNVTHESSDSDECDSRKHVEYRDVSHIPDPPAERRRGGVSEPFPEKLYRMLIECETNNMTDVVSFFPHGRAFAIHKPERFTQEIMLKYFHQTKLASFQRQLNLYGFRKLKHGPDSGGYYHELFLKGRPGLSRSMKRTKAKNSSKSEENAGPNFYAMPSITTSEHVEDNASQDLEEEAHAPLSTVSSHEVNRIMPSPTSILDVLRSQNVRDINLHAMQGLSSPYSTLTASSNDQLLASLLMQRQTNLINAELANRRLSSIEQQQQHHHVQSDCPFDESVLPVVDSALARLRRHKINLPFPKMA